MSTFKTIVFKLQLQTPDGDSVEKLPLFIQYYSFADQKWINLYREELKNGLFYVKLSASSTVKSRIPFLTALKEDQIPPLRLVPTEKLYDLKKKEVIAGMFSFSLNQKEGTFEFDFGSLWIVPKETVYNNQDHFNDFVPVASLFPLIHEQKEITNQEPDLAESYRKELEFCTSNLQKSADQYKIVYNSYEELKNTYSQLKELKERSDADAAAFQSDLKKQEEYIRQLESKIASLSSENTGTNTPVPIKNLYTDIVSEIETASRFTESSSFKLSNISLKLKAIIQKDGDSLSASLMDNATKEKVNGNSISELVFDITPVRNTEIAPGKMPDVMGLTETAVRRVLKSLDLRLNPVFQNNPKVVNGDAFKQSPSPGSDIQSNQLITVIFSKHEQQQ